MRATLAFALFALAASETFAQESWQVQDSGRQIVLPGSLDLEVISGSFIPTDCQFATLMEARDIPADCVAVPIRAVDDLQDDYVRAIEARGWRFAGGAANVFYFERPLAGSNCSDRLGFIGWLLGDPSEIAKYGTQNEDSLDWRRITHQSYILAVEPVPRCGDDRYIQ